MPAVTSYKKRLIYFIFFALLFIVTIPILTLYSFGYTFDETLGLISRGGIYVYVSEPNTSIFIGNELKKTTSLFSREVLVKNLRPQQYLVLVAHNDYWPWAKFVEVKKGNVSTLSPFLVPKIISQHEILKTSDEEYRQLASLFHKNDKSASSTKIISSRNIKVSFEDNIVYAEWKGNPDAAPEYLCFNRKCRQTIVFLSTMPISQINFYPNRTDAVILALKGGIYAVELDNRQYQNLYPIYRGENPSFIVEDDVINVQDGDKLFKMDI